MPILSPKLEGKRRFEVSELVLASVVITVVALLIIPMPPWLLDLLLATNLALSVSVLLITLYVSDALQIAAFPTILLLTTLFRLGLNVASTRLILLHGFAGEVILAFGRFVVQGNFIVGAVIFLVLCIIQFLVIAKGSERVAEVAARFALDAMPGKQMAIDAELRAGSLDPAEARWRRRQLARESQFYGAMDGAMKFVKGDVLSSFVITLINLVGGVAVGMGQRGLGLGDAVARYGLLSIGDGLVTQLPALVLSTSAGVLVTRVASEEPDTGLAEDLQRQLLGTPRALVVASGFVVALALVPGLPTLPFLVIGAALGFAARLRLRHLRSAREQLSSEATPRARVTQGPEFLPFVVPWTLRLGEELARLPAADSSEPGSSGPSYRAMLDAVRQRLFSELGLPLPPCRLLCDPGLDGRSFVIELFEIPAQQGQVADDAELGPVLEAIATASHPLLSARAADFLGMAETQALLDQLEQIAPAPIRQLLPKPLSLVALSEILRRLLEERVSIRDLKAILEALGAVAHQERDPLQLTEYVRSQLRRALSHDLAKGSNRLGVLLLEPGLEDIIRGAIAHTPGGSFLTLPPQAAREIVDAVRRAVAASQAGEAATVLLAAPDTRRFVRKLIETELPELRVVSFAELLPELTLEPRGSVQLAGL